MKTSSMAVTLSPQTLKRRREQLRMTQAEVGDATGYGDSAVSKFESGARKIPARFAMAFRRIKG
jgi:transcriptional regulator with XRE-family HTH domain